MDDMNDLQILPPGSVGELLESALPDTVLKKVQNALATLLGNFFPQVRKAEEKSLALKEKALAITITDADSANAASEALGEIVQFTKDATIFIQPLKGPVSDALDYLRATEKQIVANAKAGEAYLRPALANHLQLQKRIQQEQERLQREAAQRNAAEAALDVAVAAEQAAAPPEIVNAILDAPRTAPVAAAAPVMRLPTGVSPRTNWHAEIGTCSEDFPEDPDSQAQFMLLAKAVVEGKAALGFLLPNWPALNMQARSLKTTMAIPGVHAESKASINKRR
jgi:hypothetical protein